MEKRNRIKILIWLAFCCGLLMVVSIAGAFNQEPPVSSFSGINEADLAALQKIYYQMTPFGQTSSGWFADGSPCDTPWAGVTCENGSVVRLVFENNDFFCSIPDGILDLQQLRELSMINMGLRGIIPNDLFSLPNLQSVTFSHNLLTGPLPQSTSQTLHVLIVEDNKWTDQKRNELNDRPNLSLCESAVQYDPNLQINMEPGLDGTIPASFMHFPSLQKLDLSGNMLEGIVPAELVNLYSLYSLDLSDNNPLAVQDQALADKLNNLPEHNLDGVQMPQPAAEYRWKNRRWKARRRCL